MHSNGWTNMNKWMLEKTRWTKHMNTLTNLHFNNNICTCVHVYMFDLTFSCQTTSHLRVQPKNPPELLSHCCFDLAWAITLAWRLQGTKQLVHLPGVLYRISKQGSFCHATVDGQTWQTTSDCDYSYSTHFFFCFHHFKQVRGCFFLVAIIK